MDPGDVEWRSSTATRARRCSAWPSRPERAVLLVVGSRGSGAHAGTLLGSTSLELAEHAPVPVTIVPAAYRGG